MIRPCLGRQSGGSVKKWRSWRPWIGEWPEIALGDLSGYPDLSLRGLWDIPIRLPTAPRQGRQEADQSKSGDLGDLDAEPEVPSEGKSPSHLPSSRFTAAAAAQASVVSPLASSFSTAPASAVPITSSNSTARSSRSRGRSSGPGGRAASGTRRAAAAPRPTSHLRACCSHSRTASAPRASRSRAAASRSANPVAAEPGEQPIHVRVGRGRGRLQVSLQEGDRPRRVGGQFAHRPVGRLRVGRQKSRPSLEPICVRQRGRAAGRGGVTSQTSPVPSSLTDTSRVPSGRERDLPDHARCPAAAGGCRRTQSRTRSASCPTRRPPTGPRSGTRPRSAPTGRGPPGPGRRTA